MSRCHRLEDKLRVCEEELGRERESTRDRIEEQKNVFEKRHSALFKEYELKMQTVCIYTVVVVVVCFGSG